MEIRELCRKQWEWVESVGWHNKSNLELLALVSSEVGEAINECRHEQPTELLAEELADVVLRIADFAQCNGIDLQDAIERKMALNAQRGTRGRKF